MDLISRIRDYYRPLYKAGKVGDKVVYIDIQFPEGQQPGYFRNIRETKYCTVIALDGGHNSTSITIEDESGDPITTEFPNPDIRQPGFLEILMRQLQKYRIH